MKVQAVLKLLILPTLFLLGIASCKKKDRDVMIVEEDQVIESLTIPPSTTYFDETEASIVIQEVRSDGTLVLDNTSTTAAIEADDILIFGISDQTPTGLLKKVQSVQERDGNLVISTTDALLEEAIKEGEVSTSFEINLDDIDSLEFIDGVALDNSGGRTEGLNLNLNTALQAGVSVSGEISLTPTVNFDIDFANFSVESVIFDASVNAQSSLSMSVNTAISVNARTKLGTLYLKPIAVGLLVIVPRLTLYLSGEGQIAVGIESRTSTNITVSAGLRYDDSGWTPNADFVDTYIVQPLNPVGSASAELGLSPSVELLMYGLVGPSLNFESYVNYDVDLNRDPCWLVTAGIRGNVSIDMSRIGSSIAGTTRDVELTSREIDRSETTCLDPGNINGLVRNALTDAAIQDVLITVLQGEKIIISQTTDAFGEYNVQVPVGNDYIVRFSKDGFITVDRNNIEVLENATTIIEAILQIDEDFSGTGSIGGKITNALTGSGEPAVDLNIRFGLGSETGPVLQQAVSDANGFYLMENLEAGNYTIEANKEGFFTSYFSVLVFGGQSTGDQNGTITPEVDSGEIRIILDWGANPPDLDSHLTGPLESGGRFHTYWSDQSPFGSSAILDVDDISSFGPETITISNLRTGTYRYSVHDYSNRNSSSSTGLANSQARVRLISDSGLREFFVPTGAGTLWTVFEIQDGQVIPVNQMSFESSSDGISRGDAVTDADLIRRMPKKD